MTYKLKHTILGEQDLLKDYDSVRKCTLDSVRDPGHAATKGTPQLKDVRDGRSLYTHLVSNFLVLLLLFALPPSFYFLFYFPPLLNSRGLSSLL